MDLTQRQGLQHEDWISRWVSLLLFLPFLLIAAIAHSLALARDGHKFDALPANGTGALFGVVSQVNTGYSRS